MPTKRTKLAARRKAAMPEWARRYAEHGVRPDEREDPADWDQFLGWHFFHEEVPGLPPADGEEGQALIRQERGRAD